MCFRVAEGVLFEVVPLSFDKGIFMALFANNAVFARPRRLSNGPKIPSMYARGMRSIIHRRMGVMSSGSIIWGRLPLVVSLRMESLAMYSKSGQNAGV